MNAFEEAYRFFENTPGLHFLGDRDFCELPYLYGIFRHLFDNGRPGNYTFYLLDHLTPLPQTGSDSIVIYLSNEDHHIPSFIDQVHLVFTPYPPFEEAPSNLKPIPLGYNGDIPAKAVKPASVRSVDLFFSGRYTNTRQSFKKAIQAIESLKHLNTYFHFTRQFRAGLTPENYTRQLSDSKIALAPEGYFHSPITFRLFEAARAGCVTVSKKLPDTWFFRDYPGIELTDWQALPGLINTLMKQPQKIDQLHLRTRQHYQKYFSEAAVSQYILEFL